MHLMISRVFGLCILPFRPLLAKTLTAEEIYEKNKLRELEQVVDSTSGVQMNFDSGEFLVVMVLLIAGLVAIRRLFVG